MATYKRRMARIFGADGRALIVAMDHASQGPMAGLERPGLLMEQVVAAGADGILTSLGIATSYARQTERCGLILRLDGGSGFGDGSPQVWQRYPVSDAVAIGADAVGCMGLIGWPCEAENIRYMNHVASECLALGVPLMVEVLPFSDAAPGPDLTSGLAKGVRIAAEFGADFIKTKYTGDPRTFEKVIAATYVPVVILGGPRVDSNVELLATVGDALSAGAAGIAIGRNIWQDPAPGRLVQALRAVIHEGLGPQQAAEYLKG
jgi:DhnA family fructose-bisphosphate aldolase class Ia